MLFKGKGKVLHLQQLKLNDVLDDTFLCNLLEQNGYSLSEINHLILNTFILMIITSVFT